MRRYVSNLSPLVVRYEDPATRWSALDHREDLGVPTVLHYHREKPNQFLALRPLKQVPGSDLKGSPLAVTAASCVVGRPVLCRRPDPPLENEEEAFGPFSELTNARCCSRLLAARAATFRIGDAVEHPSRRRMRGLPVVVYRDAVLGANDGR